MTTAAGQIDQQATQPDHPSSRDAGGATLPPLSMPAETGPAQAQVVTDHAGNKYVIDYGAFGYHP